MNTAQDLVGYILSTSGGGAQDGEHHAVRHAVIHGVREVMQCRDWNWHVRTNTFRTKKVDTLGSFSAGSNKIRVVNADEFVPGRMVEVGSNFYPTPVRVIALHPDNVIEVNATAKQDGTAVPISPQVYYDLPVDARNIDTLVTNTVGTLHCYITPQEWQRLEVNTRGAGEPYYYTVMPSDKSPDRFQIRFVGMPTNDTHIHYTYRVFPRPIKYMGYERLCRVGTVELANVDGQMTVTGTKTNFPQDVAGCYIRFGSAGNPADPAGSNTPFMMERRIERWLSTSSLHVSNATVYNRPGAIGVANPTESFDAGDIDFSPPEGAIDGNDPAPYETNLWSQNNTAIPASTQYAITDVIDASPQMWTAVMTACEMWYARTAGKPVDVAMQAFNRDLRIAMETDVITPHSGRPHHSPYPTPRSMGWYSNLLPDIE